MAISTQPGHYQLPPKNSPQREMKNSSLFLLCVQFIQVNQSMSSKRQTSAPEREAKFPVPPDFVDSGEGQKNNTSWEGPPIR